MGRATIVQPVLEAEAVDYEQVRDALKAMRRREQTAMPEDAWRLGAKLSAADYEFILASRADIAKLLAVVEASWADEEAAAMFVHEEHAAETEEDSDAAGKRWRDAHRAAVASFRAAIIALAKP